MRKKALGIIGGVVLVAALGTASFFLLRNTPEEDSSSVSSSDSGEESISLTSEDPNDVTSIDITNGSGSFAVVRTAEGTGTGDDHAAYAVSGWEDLPMDTSTLWTLSNNTASMEANGVVEENCSDLENSGWTMPRRSQSHCISPTAAITASAWAMLPQMLPIPTLHRQTRTPSTR